jgi:hypothetical protein
MRGIDFLNNEETPEIARTASGPRSSVEYLAASSPSPNGLD